MHNISPSITAKRNYKLHNRPDHPVCMLKKYIQQYFFDFQYVDNLSEEVSIQSNFDELLIPPDHSSRRPTDTYYVDENTILRTHTSAHQTALLRQGVRKFLVTGDVYRKDTIDKTHYPVFHQMEGVKIVEKGDPLDGDPLDDLVATLKGLMHHLFPGSIYRILEDDFPFTRPSIQIEVKTGKGWMEVLGAGVIHPQILKNCQIEGSGWAFGLGIDRLLLQLCQIPDIRYLWTEDVRFLEQFKDGLTTFREYSRYPAMYRDIAFWVPDYQENEEGLWRQYHDFCSLVRELSTDTIEHIELLDRYRKNGSTSLAFRIGYRSHERTLTNEEVNHLQAVVRSQVEEQLDVVLR